ncbi:MAG: putative Soj/ParA-related protein [Ilumatobacteraceae bacterium]|nr:putative Soj/ParA-related protein [Ilumatobacteraceae bacterium]
MGSMRNVVAVLNQKGGVGKTTVTLGLASAAEATGRRVLVVDLDPQGSSTWVLGHDPSDVECSTAEVFGTLPITKAMVPSTWGGEIWLVPASTRLQHHESGDVGRLRTVLGAVSEQFDAVLLDCPPSLGNLVTSALGAARHALIVVEPSSLSLRGIGAVADVIDESWESHNPDLQLAGVIVNKVPPVSVEADRRYDELARIVGRKTIWQPVIPQRVIVNQAIGERRPIHSYGARSGEVSSAFDKLWSRLRRTIRVDQA